MPDTAAPVRRNRGRGGNPRCDPQQLGRFPSFRLGNVLSPALADSRGNNYLGSNAFTMDPFMTNPAATSLLDRANLDRDAVRRELARGLAGADDGELFLEYSQTEALMFDNGRLKQATYDTSQGFGLRAVKDDAVGYAHSSDVSVPALIRAADAVSAVRGGYSGAFAAPPAHTNVKLYGDDNPLDAPGFEAKVKLLAEIDAYVRAKDPRVRQVTVSLGASWQVIEILRPDGESYRDIRPLVRVNVSVVAG